MSEQLANTTPDPREDLLLAWIEGERLSPAQDLAVARLLSADPTLARQMEAMRADRGTLRSLGEVRAPADLLARAEASIVPMLERRLLLDLQSDAGTSGDMPVSIVQPERRPAAWRALLSDRVGRRFALAATTLLALGAATYFITTKLDRPIAPGPLAHGPLVAEPGLRARASEAPATLASAAEVAKEPATPDPAPTSLAAADPDTRLAAGTPAESGSSAPMAPENAGAVRLTSAEAAVLARDRRLVIRVCTKDPGLLVRPERVADRVRRAASPSWRMAGEAPVAVASTLSRPAPVDAPEIPAESPIVMAGSGPAPEPIVWGPPTPSLADLAQTARPVYVVEARLDADSIDSLRRTLSGIPATVVLEPADEPLAIDDSPVVNPAAVLWWGQPTSAWTAWGRVPVVVDMAR